MMGMLLDTSLDVSSSSLARFCQDARRSGRRSVVCTPELPNRGTGMRSRLNNLENGRQAGMSGSLNSGFI